MALRAPPPPPPPPPPATWLNPSGSHSINNRPCTLRLHSPLFPSQVGALRVSNVRIDRVRCNAHHGGISLFSRIVRIFKSYANAIVGHFEDPEKIIEQAVIDMNNDLVKMRQATAEVMSSVKQLENKYNAAEKASQSWHRRARLALQKGDEKLAREALERQKFFSKNANAFKIQLDQLNSVSNNLIAKTQLLESKIDEAKSKKDALRARAAIARTANNLNGMLESVNVSSALSAFERMEEKVLTLESAAESFRHITNDEIDEKFRGLERSSVDDDFEKLKEEVSGKSKKRALPPGISDITTSMAFLYGKGDIETRLSEMKEAETIEF